MKLGDYIEECIRDGKTYSNDGIVTSDGEFHLVTFGHTNKMCELFAYREGITMEEVWKIMPIMASPLCWFIEKLGCLVISWDMTIYMSSMTEAQKKTYKKLVESKMIRDDKRKLVKDRW